MVSGTFEMPSDAVVPTRIEHLVEEGLDTETRELLFRYNFIRYEFPHALGDCSLWARTYLHEINKVALHLPPQMRIDHPSAEAALAYLRRRFMRIEALTKDGYQQIWPLAEVLP